MIQRILVVLALLAASCGDGDAMSSSQIPSAFNIPWANSATCTTPYSSTCYTAPVPQASQQGIVNCAASLTDGFPPLTFIPAGSGGCGPWGQDLNGILKQVTQWSQWQKGGNSLIFDPAFSAAIGGYPKYATLSQASTPICFWVSTADNNTNDPDTGGTANWLNTCSYILSQANLWAGVQTFGDGNLVLKGSSAGQTVLHAEPTASGSITFPNATDTVAVLNTPDQSLSGGANVVSNNIGTVTGGILTVDCGRNPLQYLTNGGSFTVAQLPNDGSCMVLMTNNSNAGGVAFSGFTVNSNTGEPLTTTNGSKFTISLWRINGVSSYLIKALQ